MSYDVETNAKFNSIEEILADMKAGKPVVILDDDKRENELLRMI